jgi:hypothetical protein
MSAVNEAGIIFPAMCTQFEAAGFLSQYGYSKFCAFTEAKMDELELVRPTPAHRNGAEEFKREYLQLRRAGNKRKRPAGSDGVRQVA